MKTYISLLRGINVSGQKKIKMVDLKELYKTLRFKDVQTYIQSGNVIFKDKNSDWQEIVRLIENRIEQEYGYRVTVIIRTSQEMELIIKNNPFKSATTEVKKFYVTFLSEEVDPSKLIGLEKYKAPDDQYTLIGKHFYFYCPGGYGKTKLSTNTIETILGVPATTLNWNSVLALNALSKNDN